MKIKKNDIGEIDILVLCFTGALSWQNGLAKGPSHILLVCLYNRDTNSFMPHACLLYENLHFPYKCELCRVVCIFKDRRISQTPRNSLDTPFIKGSHRVRIEISRLCNAEFRKYLLIIFD